MKGIYFLAAFGLFLTWAVVLTAASQGAAVQSSAPLEGRVMDYTTGNPVVGLKLTARANGQGLTKTSVTDAKGHFKIEGMPSTGILTLSYAEPDGGSSEMGVRAGDRKIAIRIRDNSFHIIQVGEHIPKMNFKFWVNSKPLDNTDLKGKPFVLDCWFTTCPPCLAALPSLEALSKKYDGRAFVIGVHATSKLTASQLKDFAVKHGVSYPMAMDQGGDAGLFYDQFITQGSPTVAVFDKDGKLVQINGSVEDADAKLMELLADK